MQVRKNALWNCKNPHQGDYKRVLTVCSAGLLRSPTIAWYIENNSDYNCRAVGIHDYALIQLDEVLIKWADLIICADEEKYQLIMNMYEDAIGDKPVFNFDIPDIYEYKNQDLLNIIADKCVLHGVFNAKS